MRTNPISSQSTPIQTVTHQHPKKEIEKSNTAAKDETASVTFGNQSQNDFGTYKVDAKKLAEIKQDFSRQTESFKAMIRTMIEKQGLNVNDVIKSVENGETPSITIDNETRASAQESISENGYWGVTQTADRILEFAKTISGGDASKIDTLVNAFKEGFEEAKKAFGGKLPDISQQTYDKVMEGFESWKSE